MPVQCTGVIFSFSFSFLFGGDQRTNIIKMTCLKEIGLWLQIVMITLHLIVNIIGTVIREIFGHNQLRSLCLQVQPVNVDFLPFYFTKFGYIL